MISPSDYRSRVEELRQANADPHLVLATYREALWQWKDLALWIEYLTLAADVLEPGALVDECEAALAELGAGFDGAPLWELCMTCCTSHNLVEQAESIARRSKLAINANTELAINANTGSADKKTLEECRFVKSFEDHLSDLNSFLQYAHAEANRPSPNFARIRCIYERALVRFPDDLQLWTHFLAFNEHSTRLPEVYARALRVFPHHPDLVVGHLRALEKGKAPMSDIDAAFQQHPVNLDTGLAYLGISRRQDSSQATLDRCKQLLAHVNDFRLYSFMLSLLVSLDRTDEAWECWESIIKLHSHSCSFWLQFLAFAGQHRRSAVRNLYTRACAAVSDYPETIFLSWLDHENVHGSLSDVQFAESRVRQQRDLLSKRAAHPSRKRAPEPVPAQAAQDEKAPKGDPETSLTLYLSNLDYALSQGSLRSFLQSAFGNIAAVRMPRDSKTADKRQSTNRGFAYVDFACPESYNRALLSDKIPLNGRPVYITRMHEKHDSRISTARDPKTLFVSKLHHDTSAEELRLHFARYPGVKEVRLVQAKTGRSRGCAYIEFDSEDDARQALAEDGSELHGMRMSVAVSDPSQRHTSVQSNTQLIPPSLLKRASVQ